MVKVKPVPEANLRNIKEIVIPPEKKGKNIECPNGCIIKWNIKYLNY